MVTRCGEALFSGPEPETTALAMMKRRRCTKARRKVETVFLGVLFVGLSVLLYQVLTTDHVTVLSWFGVKVNQQLSVPRQRLKSSMTSGVKRHGSTSLRDDRGRLKGDDPQAGLFIDNYHRQEIADIDSSLHNQSISIAIGCAITSRNLDNLNVDNVAQVSPFLRSFLPSFCITIQAGTYQYKFFLGYDASDPFFAERTARRAFREGFEKVMGTLCPPRLDVTVRFIKCPYSGRPAWSQNDAMFTAYLDNADYYYRVNDDTNLNSKDWVTIMINALSQLHPPNTGVVGPAHRGGNEMILAYDFVHRTHIDIFGFYYPRTFPDWWADDWISGVYGRDRTRKLESVSAIHTGEKGTRYNHSWTAPEVLTKRILQDRVTLNTYLSRQSSDMPPTTSFPKGKKIISMSLYGQDPKYTYGAVRNALLTPTIFPGWILRIYVEKPRQSDQATFQKVPELVINKLKGFGAEIAYVDTEMVKVPPMMWRYLVADDPEVEFFIVRDTDSRLIARDAEVVSEWLSATEKPFHCVRDHPSHRSAPVFGGLMGGRSQALREVIKERWQALMKSYQDDYGMDIMFLTNAIWPRVKYDSLCHDSVSCRQWPHSWPFPSPRQHYEHVGQVFDPFGESRGIDIDLLQLYPEPWECTLREGESRESWLLKQKANARAAEALDVSQRRSKGRLESDLEEERRRKVESKIPSFTGKVVIWSMDYDTSYIRDLKTLLGPRGVKFIDKSLAPDCRDAGTCPHNLTVITPENGMEAGQQLANQFYERYKDDPEMRQVTHFVCFRPVAMCEHYLKFKKSLVVVATGRYEEGRLTPDRWRQLNANLTHIQDDTKHIVGANNHYDVEYMRYFTGFDPEYLPSYCAYAETSIGNRTRPEFLVAHIRDVSFRRWFLETLEKTLVKMKFKEKVVYVDDLYPQGYNLSDLAAHPGIIHVPEKISDIRVCEQYRLNIPLYFPSLELLARWHKEYKLLRNRTFYEERLSKHGISIQGSPIHPVAMGRFDPNDQSSGMSLRYWLRFADFLHLPHVGHYETLEDLVDILQRTNPRVTSGQMQRFNRRFKIEMMSKWINLINRTLL